MIPRPSKVVLYSTLAFVAGAALMKASESLTTVHADDRSSGPLIFEATQVGRGTGVTVYDSATRTFYVYPAVTELGGKIGCEFMFKLDRVGGPLEKRSCTANGL